MENFTTADTLHRLMKEAIDSGSAATIEEARARFLGYRVRFVLDAANALDRDHQSALLTGIALAHRVFLGGVEVVGDLDCMLTAPLPLSGTLRDAALQLGGNCSTNPAEQVPTIYIGGGARPRSSGFEVRTVFGGWRGGVVPAHAQFEAGDSPIMALAPMLATALAVSEAFFHVQGRTPTAGHRSLGLSLWDLDNKAWLTPAGGSPVLQYLPSHLWLIGLGHLGQAYLWALGLLPYPAETGTSLVLQDIDVITPSTFSTSILTPPGRDGLKKTREMAAWSEARGFKTTLTERKFGLHSRRTDDEPMIALCGLDNTLGRQALDDAGFSLVVEAGLGRGHRDFRTMRLHTLPGSRLAGDIWASPHANDDPSDQAAYQKLLANGKLDQCGITQLAGKAVGGPFVGAVAACLVISEVLRLLHGGAVHELIDLDLASLDHRHLVKQNQGFSAFNPGYVTTL